MLWGHYLSSTGVVIALVFYAISGHGITVGFHRYLTHGSFKANRALRTGLAVAGSLAIQGPPTRWVADHRRHHAFSDEKGDPHSPWRYGGGVTGLTCNSMRTVEVCGLDAMTRTVGDLSGATLRSDNPPYLTAGLPL
ncbi:MAG: putative fatty acid desaturase [Frankiales bacterium]|nr:putative fatty acid desaturase [Frankiales bacterium]